MKNNKIKKDFENLMAIYLYWLCYNWNYNLELYLPELTKEQIEDTFNHYNISKFIKDINFSAANEFQFEEVAKKLIKENY